MPNTVQGTTASPLCAISCPCLSFPTQPKAGGLGPVPSPCHAVAGGSLAVAWSRGDVPSLRRRAAETLPRAGEGRVQLCWVLGGLLWEKLLQGPLQLHISG